LFDVAELKLKQLSHGRGRKEHRTSNPSSSSSTCSSSSTSPSSSEARRAGRDQQGAPLAGTELQRLDNGGNSKPDVEGTVRTLSQRLGERRRELGLPDNLKVGSGSGKSPNSH